MICLLHGFMGCGDDWEEIAADLSLPASVLTPDLPGHGRNTGLPAHAYSMDSAADQLAKRFNDESAEAVDVVGYSMGGRLALHVALRHPALVRRLVMISASPGLETEEERKSRRDVDRIRCNEFEADLPGFLKNWYEMPLFAALSDAGRTALIAKRSANHPKELRASLESMGTGVQPSHWEHLHQIRVPAWAVAGARDAKFVEIVLRMQAVSSFRSIIVPDAGHALPYEQPRPTADLLARLLES